MPARTERTLRKLKNAQAKDTARIEDSPEEVRSASSDDEVPPLREDITAYSSFKQQLHVHDCSTDAELDLSGGNSLSNWWSDTDDEDKDFKEHPKMLQSLGSTVSTCVGSLSSSWGSTKDEELRRAFYKAREEELRRSFYEALRKADATQQVERLRAALPRCVELQTLYAQVELALETLRDAECCRTQLWASFYRSPSRGCGYCDETPAGAAGQTQRLLRQAKHLTSTLPAQFAAQWDPETSGEVLGRLAFAPPVRLLASLCSTVAGTPSLRGLTPCMREALLVPPAPAAEGAVASAA